MPSTFPGSCRPLSDRCSAAASAPSGGSRSPVIRRTFIDPTKKSKSSYPMIWHLHTWLRFIARKKDQGFKACHARISAGWGWATAIGWGSHSTKWLPPASRKPPNCHRAGDHLDSGSGRLAEPPRNRSDERRFRRRVGLAEMLNALLNCAQGSTWVSLHHGGGVGMGYSCNTLVPPSLVHRGRRQPPSLRALETVLWNDPATGVMPPRRRGIFRRGRVRPAGRGWICRQSITKLP